MARTVSRATSKAVSNRGGSKAVRAAKSGRFLSVTALTPVTKRATITSAQADKAVKDYLASHAR